MRNGVCNSLCSHSIKNLIHEKYLSHSDRAQAHNLLHVQWEIFGEYVLKEVVKEV